MSVRHTSCRYCELDIEGFTPYRKCEWMDRGGNTHCPHGSHKGECHAPYIERRFAKRNPRTRAKKSTRTPTLAEMRKAYVQQTPGAAWTKGYVATKRKAAKRKTSRVIGVHNGRRAPVYQIELPKKKGQAYHVAQFMEKKSAVEYATAYAKAHNCQVGIRTIK